MLQRNGPEPQEDPLEFDNCDQCSYCGGTLDEQCRCVDCHRQRLNRRAVAFIPSPLKLYAIDRKVEGEFRPLSHGIASSEAMADREARRTHNIPDDAELQITPMLDNQPIVWKRIPVVELPPANEAVEEGDEGGDGF